MLLVFLYGGFLSSSCRSLRFDSCMWPPKWAQMDLGAPNILGTWVLMITSQQLGSNSQYACITQARGEQEAPQPYKENVGKLRSGCGSEEGHQGWPCLTSRLWISPGSSSQFRLNFAFPPCIVQMALDLCPRTAQARDRPILLDFPVASTPAPTP